MPIFWPLNVGALDDITSVSPEGLKLLFWRHADATLTHHRNPLFNASLGITPEDVLVPDWLHTLSLGVYKRIIAFVWHTLFTFNIFDVDGCAVKHVFLRACVDALRGKLFAWYKDEASAGRNHAKVQALTVGMVGESERHLLGSWGAETNGLLFFTRYLLVEFGEKVPDRRLLHHMNSGVTSLISIHDIIKQFPRGPLPLPKIQEFADNWKQHLQACRGLALQFTPKHHQMAHMVRKLIKCGSPHLWGTWREESENHEVAIMAAHSHRSVWAWRVLVEHRLAHGVRRRRKLQQNGYRNQKQLSLYISASRFVYCIGKPMCIYVYIYIYTY